VRAIRILEESEASVLISAATDRAAIKPWGLEGGQEGGNASIKVYRNGEVILDNPKPRNVLLQKDDIVEMITAGAGGYGPVSERDPELLKKEYKEGIIDDKWLEEAGISIEL
ncbi:MAG: hydantoinase B/oxoprolinase family protein, partial [Firmicutes bacterium]|nr:hydantoinase B/oxoprolinase family protein [Bacillota bacterium]